MSLVFEFIGTRRLPRNDFFHPLIYLFVIFSKKQYGGSAVLDIGVYVLQLSQLIFKERPIKVDAVGNVNEDGVDYTETIILEYEGGKRAVLNTHTKLQLINQATVYGTKGRITVNFKRFLKCVFMCIRVYSGVFGCILLFANAPKTVRVNGHLFYRIF